MHFIELSVHWKHLALSFATTSVPHLLEEGAAHLLPHCPKREHGEWQV